MGHKKQESNTQQNTSYSNQNSYGYMTPPESEDVKAYRAWKPQIDPGLGYQYANAKNQLKSSFDNPLGGYTTPQMKDAQLRTGMRNLNQDESQAFRQGANDVNSQRGTQLASLSALTRPELVNTGSSGVGSQTGHGTTVQSGGFLGDLILASAQGKSKAAASAAGGG